MMISQYGILALLCFMLVVTNGAGNAQPANQTVATSHAPVAQASSPEEAAVAPPPASLHEGTGIQHNNPDTPEGEEKWSADPNPPMSLINAQFETLTNHPLVPGNQSGENDVRRGRKKRAAQVDSDVDWTDLLPNELAFQAPNGAFISASRSMSRTNDDNYLLPCAPNAGPAERFFAHRSDVTMLNYVNSGMKGDANDIPFQTFVDNSVVLESSTIRGRYMGTDAPLLLHFEKVQGGGFHIYILRGTQKSGIPLYCQHTPRCQNVFQLVTTAWPKRVQQVTILKSWPRYVEKTRVFTNTGFKACDTGRTFHRDIMGAYAWPHWDGILRFTGIPLDIPGVNGWVQGHQFPKQIMLEKVTKNSLKRTPSPLSIAVAMDPRQLATMDEVVHFRLLTMIWRGVVNYDREGLTRAVASIAFVQEPIQYTMVPRVWKGLAHGTSCTENQGKVLLQDDFIMGAL